MFYNLKIALRNLKSNGIYSIVNIVGLSVSLAACILILLWIKDELSFEKFYKRADNICLAIINVENDGHDEYWSHTAAGLSPAAREHIPGIENSCVINSNYDLGYLEYDGKKFFGGKFFCTDTTFFHVFENTFLESSLNNALPDVNSVVITQSIAKKLFGNESALGKALKGSNGGGQTTEIYYVSGVVKDQPANTLLQYDAVFSFESSKYKNSWGQWMFQNFLLLRPRTDKDAIAKELCDLHNKIQPDDHIKSYRLESLTDTHLYSPDGNESGMRSVRLFAAIAFVLLSIACINYVNLVTARSNKRSKEISVRKIMGAPKGKLFMQLLSEAAILFFVAWVIALFLVFFLIPDFVTGTP